MSLSLRNTRDAAASVLDSMGLLDASLRRTSGRYVMAYHRVLQPQEAQREWCHSAIWVRPQTLAVQLKYFSTVGRIVSLDELLEAGTDTRLPLFAITFDDAWIDNLQVLPLLEQYGVRACFFVPTDAVSTDRLFWTEELAQKIGNALKGPKAAALAAHIGCQPESDTSVVLPKVMAFIEALKEQNPDERAMSIASLFATFDISDDPIRGRVMSWDQVRALLARGHDIGSHSKSHLILRNVDQSTVDLELIESKRILQSELQREVNHFCFPNARYDAVSASRIHAAGYKYGFRMHNVPVRRSDDPALIPRFSVSEVNSTMPWFKVRLLRSHFSHA